MDFFENADEDNSTDTINELLQWWNRYSIFYTFLCSNIDGLMGTSHFSKIFPTLAGRHGGPVSHNVMKSSKRRIQEA